MMKIQSAAVGGAALVILLSAGMAQSLSGSNTVYSDDIVANNVRTADLGTNSVTRVKIADNAIAGPEIINGTVGSAEIANGAVTGAKVADGSVDRTKLAFYPVSDVVPVGSSRTFDPNEAGGHIATCPNSSPVPLGGGYSFGSGADAGFAVRSTVPLEHGWSVYGQNTLPQSKILTVYVICGNNGSTG